MGAAHFESHVQFFTAMATPGAPVPTYTAAMNVPARCISTVTLLALVGLPACSPFVKSFDAPAVTAWKPEGCRAVGPPSREADRNRWTNLHADAAGSDEVGVALAPVLERSWVAEPATYNVTGPVFDRAGRLYFSPLFAPEDLLLVSLDPATGERRFALPGTGGGASTPLVLPDPEDARRDLVYLGLYDRVLAVDTEGSVRWELPTGLAPTGKRSHDLCFGLQYHAPTDSLVGVTRDGRIYVLDRETGAQLLHEPHALPGEASPSALRPEGRLAKIGPDLRRELESIFGPMPPDLGLGEIIQVLRGGNSEIANHFSVDGASGRLWVAATAPDAADGTVDGVSELGALYALDLVADGAGDGGALRIEERCALHFGGGSASTPAISADGARVYVGDAAGRMIAVDRDCSEAWRLDLGSQIRGSIGVAADNHEVYASIGPQLVKVIDRGDHGELAWTTDLDLFWHGPTQEDVNLNLVSISASAIGFQGGVGYVKGRQTLPLSVGVGTLDRATGEVRSFVEGLDETVAVMSTGPDGALYLGNSPVRRAVTRAVMPGRTPPLIGGIVKYAPARHDLLARDASCAARDRAQNALAHRDECPDSVAADTVQLRMLVQQAQSAASIAARQDEIALDTWKTLGTALTEASIALETADLTAATPALTRACSTLSP